MGTESASAGQIISPPKGGGAIRGIGENFSPDLFTGTGNFTVPITIPPGRNGFQPHLSLVYSTGNGNGPFGFGWGLTLPCISRKTAKGLPLYDDSKDTFVLSGFEDLVPVAVAPDSIGYRPRTEGLFARVTHYRDTNNDYWEVRTKEGLTSIYGTPGKVSSDPNVIADPKNSNHVYAWKLTSTKDPFGNRIEYSYVRDSQRDGHRTWDQLYLAEVRYVDYGDSANPEFLVKVRFSYDGPIWRPGQTSLPSNKRADPFSDYRSGFEIRTTKRCTQIDVFTKPGTENLVRSYHLLYQDQLANLPLNAASLLTRITVVGYDSTNSQLLPPLEFGYTEFQPKLQKFTAITGSELPTQSLADPNTDLVDLFGQGLPDILEMDTSQRYWKNRGDNTLDIPHLMNYAPGITLSQDGVQIIDANGDGRADLLVTTPEMSGYYPMQFGGLWDHRSFQRYQQAPSFNLKDSEVHFVDLDGNGVIDAVRSGTTLECYFNKPSQGWTDTRRVHRKQLQEFPDVDFSDPRIKWAEMTGDGLQDIVLVYDGVIQYWPNLGYGNWGQRITMVDDQSKESSRPHFPLGYDPRRVLVGDIDGDGLADLVYVDNMKVTLWINQGGNRWSIPVEIEGTPAVSDTDSIRLVDVSGNGTAGILWSSNKTGTGRAHMFFLDLTGGVKPHLLCQINNHMGSTTRITYKPSTWFYLQDEKKRETRWITPLPFPVQVVARVEHMDSFSGGTLTSNYSYHHGYWDGYEREFRGFGRVDHRDSETFDNQSRLLSEQFAPPTETRTWFHQGAIGDAAEGWAESDSPPVLNGQKRYAIEYFAEMWPGIPPTGQLLSRPASMKNYIQSFPVSVRRDIFRSMRGMTLRTETYILDGTNRQDLPHTITESVYGVREESPPELENQNRVHIFFPFRLAERTSHWERGTDPLTHFAFTDDCKISEQGLQISDYDAYGQMVSRIDIAVPRGRTFQITATGSEPYLATQSVTTYAQNDTSIYIVDRVSSSITYEISNDGSSAVFDLVRQIQAGAATRHVVRHELKFYDGNSYEGLPFGQVGNYGALTRAENFAFTDSILQTAYGSSKPPYIVASGPPGWTNDYPIEFRNLLPPLAGYTYQAGGVRSPYQRGYYRTVDLCKYDFQEVPGQPRRGLLKGRKDGLGHEIIIDYDTPYLLLPIRVTNSASLTTQATYDYRAIRPKLLTDNNGNQISYSFTPLGLIDQISVMGKPGENSGDSGAAPGTKCVYTLMGVDSSGLPIPIADLGQPASIHTIRRVHHISETDTPIPERNQTLETIEYSDGFGRVIQSRIQAEDVVFDGASPGGPLLGDAGLPADQSLPAGDAVGQQASPNDPFVVVSGWQIYDNKGQTVEKYEPFFSRGWSYAPPTDRQMGQKGSLYYDGLGRLIRTRNPDNSEHRIVCGVPGTIDLPDLTNPDVFEPTPWETYSYDTNDNAGRTNPTTSTEYQQDWNTPSNVTVDALGRTTRAIERNRTQQPDSSWSPVVEYATLSTYDIMGNLLTKTDELGRIAQSSVYDLERRVLRTQRVDAGLHLAVLDAADNIIEQRDSKGSLVLHSYDNLTRPIRMWACDKSGQTVTLRERIIYGDDSTNSGYTSQEASALNLLGRPFKHYDEAGLLTLVSFDFKGNLQEKTRNVIREAALLAPIASPSLPGQVVDHFRVDWDSHDLSFLDTTVLYRSTANYDALNRIKSVRYPADVTGSRKLLIPQYNRAGALEKVDMDGTTYVERIAYNASGLRILLSRGNGLMTRYAYDTRTLRLLRLRTESYTFDSASVTYHPSLPATPLQDFGYEYDLIGNVTSLHDRTPNCGIPMTTLGSDKLDRVFGYDPIYRLVSGTGRECDAPPSSPPWVDTPRCSDITRTRAYTEIYRYDSVGNMTVWNHSSIGPTSKVTRTDRNFTFTTGSNQISQLTNDGYQYSYGYDHCGNTIQEGTDRHFEWDECNRLSAFRIQPDTSPASMYAQYLYNPGGQRVMKLVRDKSGAYEATIYIDRIFEHQRSVSTANTVENNILHVMDNQRRVATVRLGAALPRDGEPSIGTQYQLGDHLDSSNVVTDDKGSLINREEYLPYGETSLGSFTRKRYRFTGKERDEESGHTYHDARYYAPWLARWTACDQAGGGRSLNLYNYAANNPIRYVDHLGTDGEEFLERMYQTHPGMRERDIEWHRQQERSIEWEKQTGQRTPADPRTIVNMTDPRGEPYKRVMLAKKTAEAAQVVAEISLSFFGWELAFEIAPAFFGFGNQAKLLFKGGRTSFGTRISRWFVDTRFFKSVSSEYWEISGGSFGKDLHHWFFPNRWKFIPQGLRNAGLDLLETPAWFNRWMGRGGPMMRELKEGIFRYSIYRILKETFLGSYAATKRILGPEPAIPNPLSPGQLHFDPLAQEKRGHETSVDHVGRQRP